MFKSNNPVFNSIKQDTYYTDNQATYGGITTKTIILLLVAVLSGIAALMMPASLLYPLLIVSAISSIICVFVALRKPKYSAIASLIYALGEGLSLGLLTAIFEGMYSGIATAAVITTLVIFAVTLGLYKIKVLRASKALNKFILISLISLILLNIVVGISSIFTSSLVEMFYGTGNIALIFSIVLIILGSLMLVQDFERSKIMVEMGVDRNYEWSLSLGLMVSIVWIYVEALRLLAIIFSRSDN